MDTSKFSTYTTAELLQQTSFIEGIFYALKEKDDKKSYSTYLIIYNHLTEATDLIYLGDPDEFCIEVDAVMCHCSAIAIEINEDDEEAGYPVAYFTYFSTEPSIEEEAIASGLFCLDEGSFGVQVFPIRPRTTVKCR